MILHPCTHIILECSECKNIFNCFATCYPAKNRKFAQIKIKMGIGKNTHLNIGYISKNF